MKTPLFTLTGHTLPVTSVAVAPDGKWIVTGSADSTVKVWDAQTGAHILTYSRGKGAVSTLAVSPDSQWVFSNTSKHADRGEGIIWNPATGRDKIPIMGSMVPHSFVVLRVFGKVRYNGHSRDISDAAFFPDGKRVITTSYDGSAKLWDAETGEKLRTLMQHRGPINCVAVSPDGRLVATGSSDEARSTVPHAGYGPGEVRVWNAETGKEIATHSEYESPVRSVAFYADGQRVVGASVERIIVWHLQMGRVAGLGPIPNASIRFVTASPEGKYLVIPHVYWVAFLKAETAAKLFEFGNHDHPVTCSAFSTDGRRLVTGSQDCTAKVWQVPESI